MEGVSQLKCEKCSGKMIKGRSTRPGSCVMFVIGFILLFLFPIGTIIGIILMIGGFVLGNEHYWICRNCRTKIPRGRDWWEP